MSLRVLRCSAAAAVFLRWSLCLYLFLFLFPSLSLWLSVSLSLPLDLSARAAPGRHRQAASATTSATALVKYEASRMSMGSAYTVVLYGNDRAALARIAEEAFDEVDRLDRLMSHYKADSPLSRINREAADGPVAVDEELFDVIADAVRYSRESDGAFDITVGPLMKAWGFFRGDGRLPTDTELADVRQRVGFRHVVLNAADRTIRFDRPGVELDLGGIGKGYAVDRVVDLLKRRGITAALVSAGGSTIYGLGSPPADDAEHGGGGYGDGGKGRGGGSPGDPSPGDAGPGDASRRDGSRGDGEGREAGGRQGGARQGRARQDGGGEGWRVDLQDPLDARKVAMTVRLKDRALSVSGSAEKFFEIDGVRYAHIMDPRTGRPVQGVLSVAVLADRGTAGDALDNVCFVQGVEWTRAYIRRPATRAGVEVFFFLPEARSTTDRAWRLVSLSETPSRRGHVSPPQDRGARPSARHRVRQHPG